MLEEPVHASHVQPVAERLREDVPQPGPETSDDQHVPGVAIVPDAAHHPGPASGAQVDLGGQPGRGELSLSHACGGKCLSKCPPAPFPVALV